MLKGAFLVFCGFLVFCEISANVSRSEKVPASSNGSSTTVVDSSLYLSDKRAHLKAVGQLYQILQEKGLLAIHHGNSSSRVREFALMGSISDKINLKAAPRDYKVIGEHSVEMLDDEGHFNVYVSSKSLAAGEEYFYLQGSFSEGNLETALDYCEAVSEDKFRGVMASEEQKEREEEERFRLFNDEVEQVGESFLKKSSGSINNGSEGIMELLSLCQSTKCSRYPSSSSSSPSPSPSSSASPPKPENCSGEQCPSRSGVCKRGLVRMDDWLNRSLAFQRKLCADLPLNHAQWVGSHNSFNNKADGYGKADSLLTKILKSISRGRWDFVWAQQYFTITDQLNMGVRYLMLDPVYFWGKMRLCHCGGAQSDWMDKVIKYIQKVLNITLDFDSGDLGCTPTARPFATAIQEVRDWLESPGHESEVVLLMVNDVREDYDWGHKNLIWEPINSIFGDLLLTKTNKQMFFNWTDSESWPTPNMLLEHGKRVVAFGTTRIVNDSVFPDISVPHWDKDTMKYFTPYPECGGYSAGQWYTMGGESFIVGGIYNGPAEEGLIISENLPYLLQCPVSILKLDFVSPKLLASSIWSWKQGYSTANVTKEQCAVMTESDEGRWVTSSCTGSVCFHACRNASDPFQISLSSRPSVWNTTNSCPSGYEFSFPANGYQNWVLYSAMLQSNSASCTWINMPASSHVTQLNKYDDFAGT